MRRSPHRHASLPTRTTTLFVTIVALIAVGFVPARADDDMLVGPCKPHPTYVVHPGCVDDMLSPDEQLPNLVPNVDDVHIQQGFVIDPETGKVTDRIVVIDPWKEPLDWQRPRPTLAVDGDTAVVRVEVQYGGAKATRWRDLWVIRFAGDGRCARFEEWPIAPRTG